MKEGDHLSSILHGASDGNWFILAFLWVNVLIFKALPYIKNIIDILPSSLIDSNVSLW